MLQLASRLSSGAVLLSSPGWELGLCFPVPLALHSPLTSVPCWPGPTALPCHVGFARSLPSCTWNTQLDLAMGPGALPEKAMLWAEKCKCRSKSHRATSAYVPYSLIWMLSVKGQNLNFFHAKCHSLKDADISLIWICQITFWIFEWLFGNFCCILTGRKYIVISYVPYVTNVETTHVTYTQLPGTETVKYVSCKEHSPPCNF